MIIRTVTKQPRNAWETFSMILGKQLVTHYAVKETEILTWKDLT